MGRGINTELQLALATRGQLFSEAVTWSTLGFTDLEGATSRALNAITEACTEMHANPCYTCKVRVGQSMEAEGGYGQLLLPQLQGRMPGYKEVKGWVRRDEQTKQPWRAWSMRKAEMGGLRKV